MQNRATVTTEELRSTINRSKNPFLIVEGATDLDIFSRCHKLNGKIRNLQIEQRGGRDQLFKLHDIKEEITNKNVAFLADKDAYIFTGVPEERADIIFTLGYCIENDLYHGSSTINNYIKITDEQCYIFLRDVLCAWFAFRVDESYQKHNNKPQFIENVDCGIPRLVNTETLQKNQNYFNQINFREPPEQTTKEIMSDYKLYIRGKQLFEALHISLCKTDSKFYKANKAELIRSAKMDDDNFNINNLTTRIIQSFDQKLLVDND